MSKFGSYVGICKTAPLVVCPLVGGQFGVEPLCYSRSLSIGNMLVFEAATILIYVISIIMTIIMIYSIKSKYTAVGRKEMVLFFYIFILQSIIELFLTSNVIPVNSIVYNYFAAIHFGLLTSSIWCLLLNGLVAFQFVEDGTVFSVWSIRLSSFAVFLVTGFIAIASFLDLASFDHIDPKGLWVIHFIINGVMLLIYFISQVILVLKTLDDLWPLGDIVISLFFFIIGQLVLLLFSDSICVKARHYVDGLFFEAICTLLAVMMIYKYWDSVTKEDLEFSVGGKPNVWEVKELLNDDDDHK